MRCCFSNLAAWPHLGREEAQNRKVSVGISALSFNHFSISLVLLLLNNFDSSPALIINLLYSIEDLLQNVHSPCLPLLSRLQGIQAFWSNMTYFSKMAHARNSIKQIFEIKEINIRTWSKSWSKRIFSWSNLKEQKRIPRGRNVLEWNWTL